MNLVTKNPNSLFPKLTSNFQTLTPLTISTANKILNFSTKSNEPTTAWAFYESMLQQRIYPNQSTIKTLTSLMCKDGTFPPTLRALHRMRGKSCSPSNLVNLGLVFRIFGERRVDDGVLLMKRLLQKNLMIDSVVSSMIVYGHCEVGKLEVGYGLYNDMLKRGFRPNEFVYTAFVAAHCREGRVEEAVKLVEEMGSVGLKAYDDTYSFLVEGCCRFGRLEMGLRFYERMLKEGFLLSCDACNEMIGRLCGEGCVVKANEMLSVLMDRGFVPNRESYLKLIDGFEKAGNAGEVMKLKYEMEFKGL